MLNQMNHETCKKVIYSLREGNRKEANRVMADYLTSISVIPLDAKLRLLQDSQAATDKKLLYAFESWVAMTSPDGSIDINKSIKFLQERIESGANKLAVLPMPLAMYLGHINVTLGQLDDQIAEITK